MFLLQNTATVFQEKTFMFQVYSSLFIIECLHEKRRKLKEVKFFDIFSRTGAYLCQEFAFVVSKAYCTTTNVFFVKRFQSCNENASIISQKLR